MAFSRKKKKKALLAPLFHKDAVVITKQLIFVIVLVTCTALSTVTWARRKNVFEVLTVPVIRS